MKLGTLKVRTALVNLLKLKLGTLKVRAIVNQLGTQKVRAIVNLLKMKLGTLKVNSVCRWIGIMNSPIGVSLIVQYNAPINVFSQRVSGGIPTSLIPHE